MDYLAADALYGTLRWMRLRRHGSSRLGVAAVRALVSGAWGGERVRASGGGMVNRSLDLSDPGLAAAYAAAAAIIQAKAHSFHLASRFLPADKRRAVTVLYAFYRTVDDICDEGTAPAAALGEWRAWLEAGASAADDEPLRRLLGTVVTHYSVPTGYLLDLLDGVCSDLQPRQLQSYAELRHYCYQVAGTVGLVMAHVLGVRHERAFAMACELGMAMQLTNIIRDVGEDLERGRIYLPAQEMAQFGLSAADLRTRQATPAFRALMAFQISRARASYRHGLAGVHLLTPNCQLAIALAGRLYAAILRRVEVQRYDVFGQRAHTTRLEKAALAARVCLELAPRRLVSRLAG